MHKWLSAMRKESMLPLAFCCWSFHIELLAQGFVIVGHVSKEKLEMCVSILISTSRVMSQLESYHVWGFHYNFLLTLFQEKIVVCVFLANSCIQFSSNWCEGDNNHRIRVDTSHTEEDKLTVCFLAWVQVRAFTSSNLLKVKQEQFHTPTNLFEPCCYLDAMFAYKYNWSSFPFLCDNEIYMPMSY